MYHFSPVFLFVFFLPHLDDINPSLTWISDWCWSCYYNIINTIISDNERDGILASSLSLSLSLPPPSDTRISTTPIV